MEQIDAAVLLLVVWLSAAVTKTVDLLRNLFDEGAEAPAWLWNLLALGFGTGGAVLFDLNAIPQALSDAQEIVGKILTGLAIGGSASGLHELFDWLSSSAKRE